MLIALFSVGDLEVFVWFTSGALISMFSFEYGYEKMQTSNAYCMIIFCLIVVIFCEPIVLINFKKYTKFHQICRIGWKVIVIQSWYK